MGASYRASYCGGSLIGLVLIGCFSGDILKEEIFSVLDHLRQKQGVGQEGGNPKFLTSGIPQIRLKMGNFSLMSDKD